MKYLLTIKMLLIASTLAADPEPIYLVDPLPLKEKYECLESEQLQLQPDIATTLLYDVCIDPKISPLARNILRQATRAFAKLAVSKEFYACIGSLASEETHGKFISRWIVPGLGMRTVDKMITNGVVFISPITAQRLDLFADGYLNFFDNPGFDATGRKWQKYLSVGINTNAATDISRPYANDTAFWAAMVGMSIFKNMGMKEELGRPWASPLSRVGSCLLWNGKVPQEFQTREMR